MIDTFIFPGPIPVRPQMTIVILKSGPMVLFLWSWRWEHSGEQKIVLLISTALSTIGLIISSSALSAIGLIIPFVNFYFLLNAKGVHFFLGAEYDGAISRFWLK